MNRERPRYIEPHDALDEHGRPDDAQPHSDTCPCCDCNDERTLRGLEPLRWCEPKVVQQQFDDDAYRIGEGSWDSHWFHVEPREAYL